MIRQASFHCRGDPERFVYPIEIEVHKVQGNHVTVVFHFLAETIC